MKDIVEDQEDRTRGFVPPEPRGLGVRWIVLVVAAVFAAVFVVTRILPSAHGARPAGAPPAVQLTK